jgi:1,4-dihydroxy-2-naphthoyl-CoA hydrolase
VELTDEQRAAYDSPFDDLVGMRLLEASGERAVATLDLRPEHHQPNGIVHGGVYATVIEGVASVGATLALDGRGVAIGISNTTDFLRPVAAGRLRFEAAPVQVGRTLQLWQVDVTDEAGRRVAHGRVKLYNQRERA